MSSKALRRSRRAPPKKPENFQVGQLVELNRFNEKMVKVQLTQLLTEGSTTMHPRWLVVFPDNHLEEVYEHRFGKIVRGDSEQEGSESRHSSASNSPVPPGAAVVTNDNNMADANKAAPTGWKKTGSVSPTNSSGKNSPSSETDPEGKKKAVSFHQQQQQHQESDGGDSAGRKSAREERSRRRQAMIDEAPPSTIAANGGLMGFTAPTTIKRKNSSSKSGNKNKRQRHEGSADEPFTKVKFLTGTLYLYRGRHRRAEFVRRV